jgi:uncharacterized C2H2 Zn-finger protein
VPLLRCEMCNLEFRAEESQMRHIEASRKHKREVEKLMFEDARLSDKFAEDNLLPWCLVWDQGFPIEKD